MDRLRERAPLWLAGLMGGIGSLHFVAPSLLEKGVPRWLPGPRAIIYISGVMEVACAAGLIRRRPWAGPVSAAVLSIIWVGNVQMALDAGTGRSSGLFDNKAVMWGRLPFQIPMIWAALQSPR